MFDIGFWELALIGVIALLVVGPERLPALARNVGLWVGRMRRYVAHVKNDIEREIHAEEVRKLIETPAESIGGFSEAIAETQSVLKDAERELEEVEHEAQRLEQEIGQDLEAGAGGEENPSTGGDADDGPFASANAQALSPGEDQAGADTQVTNSGPQPEAVPDDEQRHAKP